MFSICKGGIYEDFVNLQKLRQRGVPRFPKKRRPCRARPQRAVALGLHPRGPKKRTRFSARRIVTSPLRKHSPSRQVTISSPWERMRTSLAVTTRAIWGNFQDSPAD